MVAKSHQKQDAVPAAAITIKDWYSATKMISMTEPMYSFPAHS
jgi:hypothetical protein